MFPLKSEGGLAGPIPSEPSWWSINQPVPEYKKKTSAADSLRGGQTTKANVIPNEGQLWGCMIKTGSAVNSGLWHTMWLTDLFSHVASATEHFPLSPHMSQQNSEVSWNARSTYQGPGDDGGRRGERRFTKGMVYLVTNTQEFRLAVQEERGGNSAPASLWWGGLDFGTSPHSHRIPQQFLYKPRTRISTHLSESSYFWLPPEKLNQ